MEDKASLNRQKQNLITELNLLKQMLKDTRGNERYRIEDKIWAIEGDLRWLNRQLGNLDAPVTC